MADYPVKKQRVKEITQNLLSWYDQNRRDLPWRHTTDPYAIWVSEIMAQQTRISALLPYYKRFMRSFPTVGDLADANPDDVLKAWEGLGYYTRARNLQKAAKIVTEQYDGQIPRTEKELRALPGIGEYTAGAILSIAYGQPMAAVDGNVLRVFARVENQDLDITLSSTKKTAKQFVAALIPDGRAGSFTQSLMELGALVCLPRTPLCDQCPLISLCKAYRQNRQGSLPVKTPKKASPVYEKTILLLCDPKGRVLVRQRTQRLLNGLWEFYTVDEACDENRAKEVLRNLGYTADSVTPAGVNTHVFTHMVWQMRGYIFRVNETICPKGYRWVKKEDLPLLAFPTAFRLYVDFLLS